MGSVDVLTMALEKPEYPGRVRGVGANVGQKQYFHTPNKSTKNEEDLSTHQFYQQQMKHLEELHATSEQRLMERLDARMDQVENI